MLELRYRFWRFVHDRAESFWHWCWRAHLRELAEKTGRLGPTILSRNQDGYHVIYTYYEPVIADLQDKAGMN